MKDDRFRPDAALLPLMPPSMRASYLDCGHRCYWEGACLFCGNPDPREIIKESRHGR